MIRLLHLADLHPSSSQTFAGKLLTDPETGKNQALTDLRRSLQFVLETATAPETRCDAAVIAGDVFDTVKPTMDEVQVVLDWIDALAKEMPVDIIAGNHDMATSGVMATALEPLKLRPLIQVFEQPGSIIHNVHGKRFKVFALPYPTRARLLSLSVHDGKSPEELTAIINQGLKAIVRGFHQEFESRVPNVLLAHGSVANAKVGDQPRSLAHDILLPAEEFRAFTYVGLGHIHQWQMVGDNACYPSSLMRQSFGEEHEAKGFNLVELSEDPQLLPVVQFVENPHARVYTTLGPADLVAAFDEGVGVRGGLNPEGVWRFKARLTPEEYDHWKPELDRLKAQTPLFQIDVELDTEDRARDAGMSAVMSAEDALTRALSGKVTEEELPELLNKHRLLVQAGAA